MERKLISAATVRQLCGGISDMTLWRWLDDAALAFPKPVYIQRRRFWREADLMAWLDAREVAA
ncbi:helix-turn-helix transcriptional regulator [Pseudogemmobacter faecipullorum]|uniref:Transcriptional regulator n=1 Tax=Pseudogemmobacter faecipullorum TaxID=2755041 RepID=A0ABS8CJ83_9RHOB|nr:transcriptional regulator [Pseudogemmobacter faecipullorum]MCB5409446.1 transcriptional regulator [Pseudogemmobacter faecipullorum]